MHEFVALVIKSPTGSYLAVFPDFPECIAFSETFEGAGAAAVTALAAFLEEMARIFVRRDSVRGLTTAAIVWLTAAVGMACGAGLPILALFVTALHFVVVFAFPCIVERLPKSRWTPSPLQVTYEDGREIAGRAGDTHATRFCRQ